MTATHNESRRLEAWTAPPADSGVPGPERDAWLALGQAIDASIPTGDNDRLLKRIRHELKSDTLPRRSRGLAWQALESLAALAAIAALVALSVLAINHDERPAVDKKTLTDSAKVPGWHDDLAPQFESLETATLQLSVDLALPESLDREFALVEQEIANLAEDLDQSPL